MSETIDLGPIKEIDAEAMRALIRTWYRTGDLRYAVPDSTTTDLNRLQECWRCRETGEDDWRDVPTVVVPGLEPRR